MFIFDLMMAKIGQGMNYVIRQNLSREQWIAVSVVMLVMGLFFMRGFGSRTNY